MARSELEELYQDYLRAKEADNDDAIAGARDAIDDYMVYHQFEASSYYIAWREAEAKVEYYENLFKPIIDALKDDI